MSDLVQWLRAQLDADERIARAATQGDWVWSREFVTPPGYHHRTIGPLEPGDAAYIAAWAPARVLRETDAKRKLVERYERAMENRRAHPDDLASAGALLALHGAVKLLALPYVDRPGFREEWAL